MSQAAFGRPDASLNLRVKGGVKYLRRAFEWLLHQQRHFKRVVFSTHGAAGTIFFGNEVGNKYIDSGVLWRDFNGRRYHELFPDFTRMYFDGCNVAEGEVGWNFLETAGKVFIKNGGIVFGWDSKGISTGGNAGQALGFLARAAPVVNPAAVISQPSFMKATKPGTVVHPWGEARYVWIGPGGVQIQRATMEEGWRKQLPELGL